jgi:hypothetical protein
MKRCSTPDLKDMSTFSSTSGVKGTSLLPLADQYAGKTLERRRLTGRRPTPLTRCEQTFSNYLQSIDTQSALTDTMKIQLVLKLAELYSRCMKLEGQKATTNPEKRKSLKNLKNPKNLKNKVVGQLRRSDQSSASSKDVTNSFILPLFFSFPTHCLLYTFVGLDCYGTGVVCFGVRTLE